MARKARIKVAKGLAKSLQIKQYHTANLVENGQILLGAEIKVNGSTTYLAYGAGEFELA